MASNIQVLRPSGQEVTVEGENFTEKVDDAPNDSDKTLTVPADKTWALQFLAAQLVTTGTPGDRQLRLEVGDGSNVIWFKDFGAVQAASLTRYYHAASDLPDDSDFAESEGDWRIRTQLEVHILPAGYTVRVYDVNTVDPTADDLAVRFVVDERGTGTML